MSGTGATSDQGPAPGRHQGRRQGADRSDARATIQRLGGTASFAGRYATADLRAFPDFVIIGTMRGGTTSLYQWIRSHPGFAPAVRKEVHYFDQHYDKGLRWYRAHFPIARPGRITGEATPYMLFHPLAPERAARDLPATTRFIVLLREPVQRAISHYWLNRRLGTRETESFERAIALESERLADATASVLAGRPSMDHLALSYVARGEYAPQLRRWFDAVGRDRILVLESEKLYHDPTTSAAVLEWLGLPPVDRPFFNTFGAERAEADDRRLVADLHRHYEPFNRELFELLGYELWKDEPPTQP